MRYSPKRRCPLKAGNCRRMSLKTVGLLLSLFCIVCAPLVYSWLDPRPTTTSERQLQVNASSSRSGVSQAVEKNRTLMPLSNYYFRIGDNLSHLIGTLWPRPGEKVDRIRIQNKMIENYAEQTSTRRRKTKLILHVGYGDFPVGNVWFKDCPVAECELANDRQRYSRSADAVLFTSVDFPELKSDFLPKPSRQIWIAEHWESPLHNRIDTAAFRGLINWTVSYRRDSTVAYSYDRFYPIVGATPVSNSTTKNYAAGKTKKVAWFVSNCYAKNARQRYATELSKHLQVC